MSPTEIALLSTIPYIVLLFGLGRTILTDPYIRRIHKRIMLLIVVLAASLIAQNVADYLLYYDRPNILMRTIVGIYGYSARPAIIVLFYYFFNDGKNNRVTTPAWCLVGLNTTLYMTALFSSLTFAYDKETYSFIRGPLGYTGHIVGAVLLIGLFLLVIHDYNDKKREMLFPITCILFIAAGVLADTFLPVDEFSIISALTIAVVVCCVFIYFWFHVQFVRQYERELMAQQRVKIMVSQIQPHFLFNTIATFRALCKRDPDKAADVAEKFGQYLRQNLDSLDAEGLIPFQQELEHTRIYADIEMVRFENVRVEYDIRDDAFSLPPLTVQPMVENAIRHGVRIREAGVVRVSTRLTDTGHEIVIRDNGIGFDPDMIGTLSGSHIGIANVRERIEKLCGGTLTIESKPDEGTTVTICIPAKEEIT